MKQMLAKKVIVTSILDENSVNLKVANMRMALWQRIKQMFAKKIKVTVSAILDENLIS